MSFYKIYVAYQLKFNIFFYIMIQSILSQLPTTLTAQFRFQF